jgi:RNA polymerase sigma-70 factor (ECF subfamily)
MAMTATTHSPDQVTDLALPSMAAQPAGGLVREEPSVEAVYREHFGFVWRSLRHLGVAEADVEDAAQDVFVVVHGKLATFEHRAKLTTWIYGICINVAQARRRRAHVRRELPMDPVELPVDEARVEMADEAYERREAEDMLDGILDGLPIEQRAVFTLFELDGRTCEEIAELCAIPVGTVYSRLRLAREAFRKATARIEARERFVVGGAS